MKPWGTILSVLAATLAAGASAGGDERAAGADDQRAGWEMISNYRFNEAESFFRELADRQPSRENRYALAVSLLNRQPKTEGTVAEAKSILADIVAAGDVPDGETTLASRFYLARILQLHQRTPNVAAAKTAFRELSETANGGFWADAAKVKWATLHLYEVTAWSEKPARLAEAEKAVARISNPTLRKDLHIILADGYEKFRVSLPLALEHLEKAWALGIERGIDQGDFLARMGELSLRTGQEEKARRYFAEFLLRFKRDERVHWIREKLRALEGRRGM